MINLLFIYLIISNLHSNSLGNKFQKKLIAFSMELFFFFWSNFFLLFLFTLEKITKIVYLIKLLTLNCLITVYTNIFKPLNLLLNRFLFKFNPSMLHQKIMNTDSLTDFFLAFYFFYVVATELVLPDPIQMNVTK